MDNVKVSLDVTGDAYDSGDRYYSSAIYLSQDAESPKVRGDRVNRGNSHADAVRIVVIPNPVKDFAQVVLKLWPEQSVTVNIYASNGKSIREGYYQVDIDGNLSFQLSTADLPSGVYCIKWFLAISSG
jgi:hypothetical protein